LFIFDHHSTLIIIHPTAAIMKKFYLAFRTSILSTMILAAFVQSPFDSSAQTKPAKEPTKQPMKEPTKEQAAVNQTLLKLFDGIATMNLQKIRQYVSSDFLVLEDGTIGNMDTLTTKISQLKGAGATRTNHLEFVQTSVRGNTAWVAYHNTAEMAVNRKKLTMRWLESAFLVKEGDIWKVRLLHSTSVTAKQVPKGF
jgi:hypothetical protein